MTGLVESKMAERDEDGGSNFGPPLKIILAFLGVVMTAGAIAGFLAEHNAQGGGPLSGPAVTILALFALIIFGLAFWAWRNAQRIRLSDEASSPREKLNHKIMAGSLIAGGLTGVVLFVSSDMESGVPDLLSSAPIAPAVAIILAFFLGIVMPVVAWFWHTRAIDELEASAYRDGGYYAAYAYLIGAPVWWILWRGGLVPAVDGVAIYLAFSVLWFVVWFWKKYR